MALSPELIDRLRQRGWTIPDDHPRLEGEAEGDYWDRLRALRPESQASNPLEPFFPVRLPEDFNGTVVKMGDSTIGVVSSWCLSNPEDRPARQGAEFGACVRQIVEGSE